MAERMEYRVPQLPSIWYPSYYYMYAAQLSTIDGQQQACSPLLWPYSRNYLTGQFSKEFSADQTSHQQIIRQNNSGSMNYRRVSNSQKTNCHRGKMGFNIEDILRPERNYSSEQSNYSNNVSGCEQKDNAKNDDEIDEFDNAEEIDVKRLVEQNLDGQDVYYSWLNCTRYKPPKLQRQKKKDGGGQKKRKLGRNPRVPFTQHQVSSLENKFHQTRYLSSMDVASLSATLDLTETRVKIWFQNRRARERRERDQIGGANTSKTTIDQKPYTAPSSVETPKQTFCPLPPSSFASAQFSHAIKQNNCSAFNPV